MFNFEFVIKAIFLGLVEGLTEFIPVSSTAHLLLASKLIDFSQIGNGVFEISIQLGAIFAICFLYRQKLLNTLFTANKSKQSRKFILNVALAFFPAVFAGMLLYSFIKSHLFSIYVVATTLIIGGLLIIWIEKLNLKPKTHKIENLTKTQALLIGLFQIIAMIPGVSRSGATIMGGLILKLDRKVATEFSFFLAIPTIFGAVAYDLLQNYQFLNSANIALILVGFISAFFSSLLIIKWLIRFISHNNFIPFAYYRVALGAIIWIIALS